MDLNMFRSDHLSVSKLRLSTKLLSLKKFIPHVMAYIQVDNTDKFSSQLFAIKSVLLKIKYISSLQNMIAMFQRKKSCTTLLKVNTVNLSNRKLLFQLMNKVLVICFFIISLTMILLLWFQRISHQTQLRSFLRLCYHHTGQLLRRYENQIGQGNGYFGEISVMERYQSLKWKASYRIGVHTIV